MNSQLVARFVLLALLGALAPGAGAQVPQTLHYTVPFKSGEGYPRYRIPAIWWAPKKPLLDFLKLLGPNPRAIVLGIGMIAGSPVYYFFYQVVVLNLLLLISVQLHNRAAKRTASRI